MLNNSCNPRKYWDVAFFDRKKLKVLAGFWESEPPGAERFRFSFRGSVVKWAILTKASKYVTPQTNLFFTMCIVFNNLIYIFAAMRIDKQRIVMSALRTGRYTYEDGEVFTMRRGKRQRLLGGVTPEGYRQVFVSNHKRGTDRSCTTVFVHQLVYLMHHGVYREDLQIDHIDRVRSNNRIDNLRAVTSKENNSNKDEASYTDAAMKPSTAKLIRHREIKLIRALMDQGKSQSAIARELGLSRLAVRYVYNKIKNGEPLRYEVNLPGPK